MNGTTGCLSTDALIQINIIDVNDEAPRISIENGVNVSKIITIESMIWINSTLVCLIIVQDLINLRWKNLLNLDDFKN